MWNIPDSANTMAFAESLTRTSTVSDLGFLALNLSVPTVASRPLAIGSHEFPPSREMLTSTLDTTDVADQSIVYLVPMPHSSPELGDATVNANGELGVSIRRNEPPVNGTLGQQCWVPASSTVRVLKLRW